MILCTYYIAYQPSIGVYCYSFIKTYLSIDDLNSKMVFKGFRNFRSWISRDLGASTLEKFNSRNKSCCLASIIMFGLNLVYVKNFYYFQESHVKTKFNTLNATAIKHSWLLAISWYQTFKTILINCKLINQL